METLVYICLSGIFAYHCLAIYKDFRGSSLILRKTYGLCGSLGYTVYFVVFIWSFWHFKWYWLIGTCLVQILLGGLTAWPFQWTIIGMMLSPILGLVATVLSICKLAGVW